MTNENFPKTNLNENYSKHFETMKQKKKENQMETIKFHQGFFVVF